MKIDKIKRISVISAVAVFFFVLCAVHAAARPFGDVDNDGAVTSEDAREILRAAVELTTLTGETRAASDLDEDGSLSSADARLALRAAVGLEALRSVEEAGKIAADVSGVGAPKNGIYTYNTLTADLAALRSAMPSRFSYRSLGKTADGRDIFCVVLGSGYGARQIVSDVGIHGSEHMNPPAVMRTLALYLQNYDKPIYQGRTVRQILDDTDLYIIPMLNPDGIAISQWGLSGLNNPDVAARVRGIYNKQRAAGGTKLSLAAYLKMWKANANGVDLNRNFRFTDKSLNLKSQTKLPANRYYAGDRSHPEAETAAYCALVGGLSAPVASLSIHSQGGLIYWLGRQTGEDKAAAKRLATTVSAVTGYRMNNSENFVCAAANWSMIEKKIPAITVECGVGRTPLPASELPKIYAAVKNLYLAVAVLYEPPAS